MGKWIVIFNFVKWLERMFLYIGGVIIDFYKKYVKEEFLYKY